MSKSYIFHTSRLQIVKEDYVPASTIVLKKEGNNIIFGISMCSKDDNFSRKFGRESAEERMNKGFGSFEIKGVKEEASDHDVCMFHLYSIAESVILHGRKWRKRIASYNAKKVETIEIVNPYKPLITNL